EIDFPIFMETRVTVPYFGTVRAESNDTAHAYVATIGGSHTLWGFVRAEVTSNTLRSTIGFHAEIMRSNEASQPWVFAGYVDMALHGTMGALHLIYEEAIPVFKVAV
ncbi:hypothetical protein FOZ60_015342, partial [Perkinsus olseni]